MKCWSYLEVRVVAWKMLIDKYHTTIALSNEMRKIIQSMKKYMNVNMSYLFVFENKEELKMQYTQHAHIVLNIYR